MTQLTGPNENVLTLPPAAARSVMHMALSDVSQLTKPRITLLVVATAWIGFVIGSDAAHVVHPWVVLAGTLVGTALSCMGASAFNQVLERDVDALMNRTKDRPIPSGRVSVTAAALLGTVLSCLGVGILAVTTNTATAALSAITILSYALIYTPMKRVSSVCTIVGAVPGALPPVMGYVAAAGGPGVAAWAMFAILFLWQLPHFLAIAWLYRDDYAAAGLPMLPVLDPDGRATARQILLGCLVMLPIGLAPTAVGMSGKIYFVGALIAGLVFLAFGVRLALNRTRANARALFFASLVYLPLVFALMVIDRA
ncbi:MAG: heme o synthase [Planctomycetes bacterium]|nr:heme o synthase [Planctomycetota bacterium]